GDAAAAVPRAARRARSAVEYAGTMTMYGPSTTFLGVPRCDLAALPEADVVILGAPFDGGTSFRPGTRFGPSAIRQACYLPQDGSRPSLALRVDALKDLR